MKRILIIDAVGKRQSNTKKLADAILHKLNYKEEQVEYLDLYSQKIPNLNADILNSRQIKKYETEDSQLAQNYLEQFEQADEYIFIFPTWNWSVPAILKQYIDLIMVSGHNFTYRKGRIVGLLKNKNAIIINTTGGPLFNNFWASLFGNQNGVNYIKGILKVLGIKNIKVYTIDKMSFQFKNKKRNLKFDEELYEKEITRIVNKI